MKTKLTNLTLVALLSAVGTTAAIAHEDYSESGTQHWLSHVSESTTGTGASAPASVIASNTQDEQTIPLKNGTVLHIFKDGKMAMEDQYGRPVRMNQNEVMETKNGDKIMMHGDEVMRLDELLNKYRGS